MTSHKVAELPDAARADVSPRAHRVPQGNLTTDLVEQPSGTTPPRDPPTYRRRRDPPRPQLPIRLVGAVLAEQHDDWIQGRRYLGLDVLSRSRMNLIDGTLTEDANPLMTPEAIRA